MYAVSQRTGISLHDTKSINCEKKVPRQRSPLCLPIAVNTQRSAVLSNLNRLTSAKFYVTRSATNCSTIDADSRPDSINLNAIYELGRRNVVSCEQEIYRSKTPF